MTQFQHLIQTNDFVRSQCVFTVLFTLESFYLVTKSPTANAHFYYLIILLKSMSADPRLRRARIIYTCRTLTRGYMKKDRRLCKGVSLISIFICEK